jgi:hypothetical protein
MHSTLPRKRAHQTASIGEIGGSFSSERRRPPIFYSTPTVNRFAKHHRTLVNRIEPGWAGISVGLLGLEIKVGQRPWLVEPRLRIVLAHSGQEEIDLTISSFKLRFGKFSSAARLSTVPLQPGGRHILAGVRKPPVPVWSNPLSPVGRHMLDAKQFEKLCVALRALRVLQNLTGG